MIVNTNKNMEDTILEAAASLFLEKGFKSTSVTEIAQKAGCNQALVHYYYRTKKKLFEDIFEKKMKLLFTSLIDKSNTSGTFEEKIIKITESHFEAVQKDPKLPLFFFSEISSNPQRLDAIKTIIGNLPQQFLRQMSEEMEAEIKKGKIRDISFLDLLLSIISLNIMTFLAEPMFKAITQISDAAFYELQNGRKKENVHIILQSLKP